MMKHPSICAPLLLVLAGVPLLADEPSPGRLPLWTYDTGG